MGLHNIFRIIYLKNIFSLAPKISPLMNIIVNELFVYTYIPSYTASRIFRLSAQLNVACQKTVKIGLFTKAGNFTFILGGWY